MTMIAHERWKRTSRKQKLRDWWRIAWWVLNGKSRVSPLPAVWCQGGALTSRMLEDPWMLQRDVGVGDRQESFEVGEAAHLLVGWNMKRRMCLKWRMCPKTRVHCDAVGCALHLSVGVAVEIEGRN